MHTWLVWILAQARDKAPGCWLTGVGDSEAVGCLDVVHVRHQGEWGFRGIGAGVVQEDSQAEGRVLLIGVSDEQTTCKGKKSHPVK